MTILKHDRHHAIRNDQDMTDAQKGKQHAALRKHNKIKNKRRTKWDFSNAQKREARSKPCGCGLPVAEIDHIFPIDFMARFAKAYREKYGTEPNDVPHGLCEDCHEYKSNKEMELLDVLRIARLNGHGHKEEKEILLKTFASIKGTLTRYQTKKAKTIKAKNRKTKKAGSTVQQKITKRRQKIRLVYIREKVKENYFHQLSSDSQKAIKKYRQEIETLEKG